MKQGELSRRVALLMHTPPLSQLSSQEQAHFALAVATASSFAELPAAYRALIIHAEHGQAEQHKQECR